MIDAIVLAGGLSQRMGKPKPLLRFGDTTFLERIVAALRGSAAEGVTVVLGAGAETVERSADLSGTDVVINPDYRQGQLSSLVAALRHADAETEAVLVCLVDNPFITPEIVDRIIAAFRESGSPIVVPVFNGRRGHPALFARPLFEALINAPPEEGARHVVHANQDKILEIEMPDDTVLTGIDTPEDYRSHFGIDP